MAGKNVYESNVSSIRILRYRTQAVADGEDPDDGPFVFLLFWSGEVCSQTSFLSLKDAWSVVQAIDAEIVKAADQEDDALLNASLEAAKSFKVTLKSKDEVLQTLGLRSEWQADYDFRVLFSAARSVVKAMAERAGRQTKNVKDDKAEVSKKSTIRVRI